LPYFTRQVAPNGSLLVVAVAGVSQARRNALIAAGQPIPNPVNIQGLIDTGASNTCIDPSVLTALNLSPTGSTLMNTPSTGATPVSVDTYDVSLTIFAATPHAPLMLHTIPVSSSELLAAQGFHALIGRDILKNCLLTYDGQGGLFSLAF
jgi:hypothetical protein